MIKLYMMDGKDEVQSFDVEKDTVYIGRSLDNDIEMKDAHVSRKHLKITRRGDRHFVQDLRSANGTFVDGEQIPKGVEIEVKEGVPITLGVSLICLGKACLEDVMPFVDSIYDSDELNEISEIFMKNRPMTAQRNMELIYNVSDVLKRSLSLKEILEHILNHVFNLLQRIDRGVIVLIDSESGKTTDALYRHKGHHGDSSMSYSRSVVERVLREGKAVTIRDTFNEAEVNLSDSIEMLKIRSVLCVPLISKSKIRGVMYLDSIKEPNGFRNEDLSLLTALSSPAAIAIENALLTSKRQPIEMS
jgi:3',5'-cyclic-nucleotide phosphodiesterase